MPPLNRRHFLRRWGATSGGLLLSGLLSPTWSRQLQRALDGAAATPPGALATDEEFWYYIQQSFTVSPGLINLNNGGVSPAPRTVQEAMKRYYDLCNEAPSYYMWRILDAGREPLRASLAAIGGCSAEEIAINRNASEGMATVIFGLPLQRGDEVVVARQDYPNIINAWKQREQREGIRISWINLDLPGESTSGLVERYAAAFTPQTKVVNVTHVINWTGQIMPVRAIADEARKRGIAVAVDGAHSFAHFKFSIPDLGADYFATSLHKWLFAPIGTGMLYVKRNRIRELYPLLAADNPAKDDIRKFEHLGTRPFYIEQAIGKAIEFHDMIGIERKEKRLHHLKNYWMKKVEDLPGVRLHTSPDPKWGCAIGLVSVEGRKPGELDSHLYNHFKVHTTTVQWENISGVRITPNVYTTTKQLDVLVEGIKSFLKKT